MDSCAVELLKREFASAFSNEAAPVAAEAAAERLRHDPEAAAVVRDAPELMRLLRRAVGTGGPLCESAASALEACWPCQACAEGVAEPRGVVHQSYVFPGGLKVPLRELGTADDRLGEGGCVWGAAMLLAAQLCAAAACDPTAEPSPPVSAPCVRGRSVLELGAGCGLCGLVAAALGAERAVLSEVAEPVLVGNLEANIALQAPGVAARCRAAALDWEAGGERPAAGSGGAAGGEGREGAESLDWVGPADTFDLIIGSDLLLGAYKSVELLPGVISRHLAEGGSAALLNAVRSRDRLEALLRGFAAAGLEARHRELSRAEVEEGFRCGASVDGARTAATYEGGFVLILVDRAEAVAPT